MTVDVEALRGDGVADRFAALSSDPEGEPALRVLFAAIDEALRGIDLESVQRLALTVTDNAGEGFLLLARLNGGEADRVVRGADWVALPDHEGERLYAGASRELALSILDGDTLAVGKERTVRSVIDVFVGNDAGLAGEGAIAPYLPALSGSAHARFVYGLPALYAPVSTPGPGEASLRAAEAVTGALTFADESFAGEVAVHTANAAGFAAKYRELLGDPDPDDVSPEAREPLAEGLPGFVSVRFEDSAWNKTPGQRARTLATLKNLTHGMDAVDHAAGVGTGANDPWMSFEVGGSSNSIFVNYELSNEEQVAAFERNVLPDGFRLAPIRILESDAPAYFLVLNVYGSSGGLVTGARAEWSVFVHDPEADHPRFLVVQAAAAALSADPVNLLTDPEPVTHELQDDRIVSHVGVKPGPSDAEQTYWRSSIAWPQDPGQTVGFAREFVAANDRIYWGNGVCDRVLYNASAHNRPAVLIPDRDIEIIDATVWKEYLKPRPTHAFVYLNPLEFVISPWWNLDAAYLDVTAEHRADLVEFKDGFYPSTVQQLAADALRGAAGVPAGFTVDNRTPGIAVNFAITDPEGMEGALGLPPPYALRKIRILTSEIEPDHYLTLRVYEVDGSLEGTRAEWLVYVGDGAGPVRTMNIETLSAGPGVDPVRMLRLPGVVDHERVGDELRTRLVSASTRLELAVDLEAGQPGLPTLDRVEAGDQICHLNAVCDRLYYDGGTLEEEVLAMDRDAVEISALSTEFDAFIDAQPRSVTVRENAQRFARDTWFNLADLQRGRR
jgi:hypothetical protein